jgi:uncharacterized protein (TIGR02271 family)
MTLSRLPKQGVGEDGWSVRLPVRAEEITLSKETVVRERVVVKRDRVQDSARVYAVLQREQLRINTEINDENRRS